MSDQRLKATFPIHYAVSYKPFRAQNARHTRFPSEASVEFRAVPRDAVRTVMRAVSTRENALDRGWNFREPLAPKADGTTRDIVEFEGRLWIEAVPLADTIEGLEKRSGKGTPFVDGYGEKSFTVEKTDPANQNAWSKPALMTSPEQISRYERATLSEFNDDKGDKMRADLTRTADAMIAIDGMLYARFREPALSVPAPGDDRHAVTFVGAGDGSETYATDGLRYAAVGYSSYSDAATKRWSLSEHATALAERKRGGGGAATPEARFEVLDPEVLTACPHVAACLDLATESLKALWKHPMALRHGVIEHAVELRDALSACRRQITPRLRRALDGVARIEPLSATDRAAWEGLAAVRPRMRTWNGQHYGEDPPLTRASQVVAHAGEHAKAAELASAALHRLAIRNKRLSWEERALDLNVLTEGETTSYELLSSQAVAIHADKLGVDAREAIRAARDDGARIFMTEDLVLKTGTYGSSSGKKRKGGKAKKDDAYEYLETVTALLAVVDEAPDGSLSVRSVLHGARKPSASALALLDRHLAEAAPAPEPALAPGM